MIELLKAIKRFVIFCLAVAATYLTYRLLLTQLTDASLYLPWILLIWLFTAYVVLPRVHRRLVKLYLPDYFIGRSRTVDGLLGDPVNLAIIGNKNQLRSAMKEAGWIEAEELDLGSAFQMVWSSIFRKSYPGAPISPLFLFGENQALAFQQEVNGNPHERHHVRFWATPSNWWLPGGYECDWLGAASYDRRVGFSAFTLQFTHKIDAEIDKERDYLVKTLQQSKQLKDVKVVEHYASGFHARNGGGDHVRTDGNLPFVKL
jgi:hypothetical protein